jgi:putative membrane protein
MSIRLARTATLLGACLLSGACAKTDNKADSAAAADSAAKAAAAAAPPAAPTPPPLTDANIAAILDAANAADSAAGKIASTKGTRADVKEFGRTMMRDHHTLRKQGEDLVKKLNVTPAMPAGDTSQAAAQHWQDSLNAMAKGAAWDKAYIYHEVAYHQAVLQIAQTALAAAQNAELKDLITKAAPNIQAHLTKAQDIQSKLNAAPAAGATADTGAAKSAMDTSGKKGAKKKKP